jgi:hypothetical protein
MWTENFSMRIGSLAWPSSAGAENAPPQRAASATRASDGSHTSSLSTTQPPPESVGAPRSSEHGHGPPAPTENPKPSLRAHGAPSGRRDEDPG